MNDYGFYMGSGIYETDVRVNATCLSCDRDNEDVDGVLNDGGYMVSWECEHCQYFNQTDYDRD